MKSKKKLGDYLGKKNVKAKMGKMKSNIIEPGTKRLQFGAVVSGSRGSGGGFSKTRPPGFPPKKAGESDKDYAKRTGARYGTNPNAKPGTMVPQVQGLWYPKDYKSTNEPKTPETKADPRVGARLANPKRSEADRLTKINSDRKVREMLKEDEKKSNQPFQKPKETSPRERKQNTPQGTGAGRTGKSGSTADSRRKAEMDRTRPKVGVNVGRPSNQGTARPAPRKPGEPERGKRKIDSPSQRRADELIKKPKPTPKKPAPAPERIEGRKAKQLPVSGGGSKRPGLSINMSQSQSQSQSQGQKQEQGRKMKDRRSRVDRIKDRAAKRVGKIEGRQERRAERRKKIGAAKSKVVGAIDNVRGKMARRREAVKGAKAEAREQIKKARGKAKKGMMKYKPGGFKPDYLDFDKDGNKNEPMKSALKDRRKGGYGKKKK